MVWITVYRQVCHLAGIWLQRCRASGIFDKFSPTWNDFVDRGQGRVHFVAEHSIQLALHRHQYQPVENDHEFLKAYLIIQVGSLYVC